LPRRILVIAPVRETSVGKENTRKIFQKYAWSGTKIDVVDIPEIASLNFVSESVLASPLVLAKVVEAEKRGYDGVVISCFLEPGVQIAQESVSIPVLGPMRAAFSLANLLGRRIGLVGIGPRDALPGYSVRPLIKAAGLDTQVVSMRQIPFDSYHMSSAGKSEFQVTQNAVTHEIRESMNVGQTDIVVLCCTGLSGFIEEFRNQAGIPVIDGAIAALKMCETMIDMKFNSTTQLSGADLSRKRSASKKTPLRLIFSSEKESRIISHDRLVQFPSEDTEVDVCWPQRGTARGRTKDAPTSEDVLDLIRQSERDGFRAVVVGTFDPQIVVAGRELAKIPVIGLLETSMSFASAFYNKVGLLSDATLSEQTIEASLREWSLTSVPSIVRPIGINQQLRLGDSIRLKHRILGVVQELQESGVDVLVPCSLQVCAILEAWKREIKMRVLNPLEISLRTAEMLCSIGLSHSKLAYPTPVIPRYTFERLRRAGQLSDLRLLLYENNGNA
jgi:allantoin racemase